MNHKKTVHISVITIFVLLYAVTSIISTIHVIDFFKLTNNPYLAISIAIAFELGAAASLASLIVLDKMNKTLIWMLFITLTLMQMLGNMYYCFVQIGDDPLKIANFVNLLDLKNLGFTHIDSQRLLSIISGAILPLIALGFIKSLVDYINPSKNKNNDENLIELESEIKPEIEPKTESKIEYENIIKEPKITSEIKQKPIIDTKIKSVEKAPKTKQNNTKLIEKPFIISENTPVEKPIKSPKISQVDEDEFRGNIIKDYTTGNQNIKIG